MEQRPPKTRTDGIIWRLNNISAHFFKRIRDWNFLVCGSHEEEILARSRRFYEPYHPA